MVIMRMHIVIARFLVVMSFQQDIPTSNSDPGGLPVLNVALLTWRISDFNHSYAAPASILIQV